MLPYTPNYIISHARIYRRHILVRNNIYPIPIHLLILVCHPERSVAQSKDLLSECKPYTLSLVGFEEILHFVQNDNYGLVTSTIAPSTLPRRPISTSLSDSRTNNRILQALSNS